MKKLFNVIGKIDGKQVFMNAAPVSHAAAVELLQNSEAAYVIEPADYPRDQPLPFVAPGANVLHTFTVFITDAQREPLDLFVQLVEVDSPLKIEAMAVELYDAAHQEDGAFYEREAKIVGVCYGSDPLVWNPEGIQPQEYGEIPSFRHFTSTTQTINLGKAPAQNLPKEDPIKKAMTETPKWHNRSALTNLPIVEHMQIAENGNPWKSASEFIVEDLKRNAIANKRFPEVEKVVTISTAHISADNLRALEAMEINSDLPFWILSTGFGYICRFEAAIRMWEEQDDANLMHPLQEAHLDDTFSALCCELAENGFQVVHLDQDGPLIEDLHEYDH